MQLSRDAKMRFVRDPRDKFRTFYETQTGEFVACTWFEAVFSKGCDAEYKLNVFLAENHEK